MSGTSVKLEPNKSVTYIYVLPQKGTYYLNICVQVTANISENPGYLTIKPYLASTEDRTLASGKFTTSASNPNGYTTYYRINVPQDGYIGIQQENTGNGTLGIDLCDKEKVKLAGKNIDGNAYCYPVKKGTYYLKTSGVYQTNGNWFKLKYTFYKQNSAAFSMTHNKVTTFRKFDDRSAYYLRVKADKTGTMKLYNTGGNEYVTLCNSKKNRPFRPDTTQ